MTLIEMLVSVAILLILMALLSQIVQLVGFTWKSTVQTTGSMQATRVAFERMTRNLSQATLNTYYSYFGGTPPTNYFRQSELQFVSGVGPPVGTTFLSNSVGNASQITHAVFFQAPLGIAGADGATDYSNLSSLLNACGYFVIYAKDPFRPSMLDSVGFAKSPPQGYRYRLMEYLQPSQYLSIYSAANAPNSAGTMPGWISTDFPDLTLVGGQAASNVTIRPIADNIVALIIMPEQFAGDTTSNGQANTSPVSSVTSRYNYDSAYMAQQQVVNSHGMLVQTPTGNQLPPLVKVVMIAIDEASAIRLAASNPAANSATPRL